MDACAHGNSVYPVVIQPQSLQQQSMRYISYKSVLLYLDGLIRRLQGFSTYGLGAASTPPLYFEPEVVSYDTDG